MTKQMISLPFTPVVLLCQAPSWLASQPLIFGDFQGMAYLFGCYCLVGDRGGEGDWSRLGSRQATVGKGPAGQAPWNDFHPSPCPCILWALALEEAKKANKPDSAAENVTTL